MTKKQCLFVIGFLFLCFSTIHARGIRERFTLQEPEQTISVTGIVRLVGSRPFYDLVISSPQGEWYIARDEMAKLRDFQHRTVSLQAVETVTELASADYRFIMIRRELRNVKILQIYE